MLSYLICNLFICGEINLPTYLPINSGINSLFAANKSFPEMFSTPGEAFLFNRLNAFSMSKAVILKSASEKCGSASNFANSLSKLRGVSCPYLI